MALANVLKTTPVIYCAITDPIDAGLVKSLDRGEEYITGVSDMTPVREQIEFLGRMKPLKRLGVVYSSSEANAVVLRNKAKEACAELGIEFVEAAVTNSAEVRQAAQSIAGRVDAFYVGTDNTVISAVSSLADVAMTNRIPIMSADPSSAETNAVFAAWGFDHYKMGRASGKIVGDVLKGKKPKDIPTLFMTDRSDMELLLNQDVANRIGINIPKDILDSADILIRDGKLIRK